MWFTPEELTFKKRKRKKKLYSVIELRTFHLMWSLICWDHKAICTQLTGIFVCTPCTSPRDDFGEAFEICHWNIYKLFITNFWDGLKEHARNHRHAGYVSELWQHSLKSRETGTVDIFVAFVLLSLCIKVVQCSYAGAAPCGSRAAHIWEQLENTTLLPI